MLSQSRRFGRGAVTKLLLFVLLVQLFQLVSTVDARAVTGYRVYGTGGAGLNIHSSPHAYSRIGGLAEGTPLDIQCQQYGRQATGDPRSNIWDKLNSPYGGGWVSDWYVSTPGAGQFTPGIPRCDAPPPPPSREDKGVAWAMAQKGQSHQPDGRLWRGWCDRFVANAFGRANSGYDTAELHWQDLARRGLTRGGEPPYGALAFYAYRSWGHVTISLGNGRVITTPLFTDPYPGVVREAGLYEIRGYRGWAWANPEWAGR